MHNQPDPPDRVQLGSSPRIVLVRLSAIGDVVHTMPVATAIKERFPEAELLWVASEPGANLLEGHEAIDQLLTLPRGFLKKPSILWQTRRRLRQFKPDLAIDSQGLTKSSVVAWLSGAKTRIGFAPPWGRELSRALNNVKVETPLPHAVDRMLQLLKPLGIDSPDIRFALPISDADSERVREHLKSLSLKEGGYAIFHVGAGWPSKLWPVDRFAAVARYLWVRHKLKTLVTSAGVSERERAEELIELSGDAALLAPAVSLRELASLSRGCRVFLSGDTGPLHIADAVGASCIGLYGPFPAEKHGPYGPQSIALQKARFEGTTRERRRAPPEVMEAITVEDVCDACEEILSRKK